MRFCLILLFIFSNSQIVAQLSGEYRIGQNQPAPFNTIASAVVHLNTVGISGNVTYLLEDEYYYEENILIQNFTRASPTDSFVLMPAPGIFSIIEGSGSANYVIGLSEVKNVVIAGNEQACGEPRLKILATENVRDVLDLATVDDLTRKVTENVTVQACHIERASAVLPNQGGYTIVMGCNYCNFDNIRIVHNRFSGNGEVFIIGAFDPVLQDVYIQDNWFENCGSIDIGRCKKTVFEGNYLENLHARVDGAYYRAVNFQDIEELLFSSNKISGVVTSDNSLHLDLIQLRDIRSGLFSNNTIEGINYFGYNEIAPGSGTFVGNETRLVYLYGCKDIKMYNNTFNIYPQAGLGLNYDYASTSAVSISSRDYDIQLKNNIFRIAQGNASGGNYETYGAILSGYSTETIEDVVLDNNIYYVSGQANNVFSMVWDGSHFAPQQVYSYQEHNAAFPGNNVNSYWQMPSFVSDTDLHLATDCNRGQVLSEVPLDIEGHLRHKSTPDIGAYEYFNGEYLLSNGNDTICSGSSLSYWTAYKQPGWFYEWGIYGNAATITDGAGTDSICVEWDKEPGPDSLWMYSYNKEGCKSDTSVFKVVKSERPTIRFPKELLCYGEVLSVELIGKAPWDISYKYNNQEIEIEGINEVKYELGSETGFYKLLYVSNKFCKNIPVNIANNAEIQEALKVLEVSPK